MPNVLENLHRNLTADGYQLGSLDDFKKAMADSTKAANLYKNLSADGYQLGSQEDFFNNVGNTSMKPQPTQQPAEQPQQQTPTQKVGGGYKPTEQEMMGFNMTINSALGTARNPTESYDRTAKDIDTYQKQQAVTGGVAKNAPKWNPETGHMEQTYLTSAGTEYNSKDEAADVQRKINDAYWREAHPLDAAEREIGQDLRDIRSEEERLTEQRKAAEENKRPEDKTWWDYFKEGFGASAVSGMAPMGTNVDRSMVEAEMARKGAYGSERQAIAKESDVLMARRRLAEEARQLITDVRKDKQGFGILGGFARAGEKVLEKALDQHTWDFGEADLASQMAVADAVIKSDSGLGISQNEQKLLDTWAKNAAINSKFADQLSGWTKAGIVTGESLPFMLEMAMNPASGLGEAATTQLLKYSLKKYGTKWVKDHAKSMLAKKIATRLVGDVVGAGIMASTTGAARVAADYERRMTGQADIALDDKGDVIYNGIKQDTKENPGAAFFKALSSTSIENWSEMAGNYLGFMNSFFGKALGKTAIGKAGRRMLAETGSVEGVSLNKAQKFIYELASNGIGAFSPALKQFAERTQWHGVVGEYLEEVMGNIANAAVVGDKNFNITDDEGNLSLHEQDSVWNLQDNIDTFCGVSLMGGFMSALNTVGYAKHRYDYDVDRVSNANAKLFGDELWEGVKTMIDNSYTDPRELNDALTYILRGESGKQYSAEEKKAVLKYTQAVLENQGAEMATYQPRMASSTREEVNTEEGKKYVVTSLDKNGNSITQQAFDSEDEAMAYEGELKMNQQQRDYKDYLSMTNKLSYPEAAQAADEFLAENGYSYLNDDDAAAMIASMNDPKTELGKQFRQYKMEKILQKAEDNRAAIESFEEENGWTPGTVAWLAKQDPMQLDAEGLAMADQARTFLEGLAYPAGEVHVEHEQQVGAETAKGVVENVVSDEVPIEPGNNAGSQLLESFVASDNALTQLFERNEDLKEEYTRLVGMGLSPQEVISSLDSFRPEEVQAVIDHFNAKARYLSFMDEAAKQIDNAAHRSRENHTFKGTIDGVADLNNVHTISDGTNQYYLVSGNVTTDPETGRITGSTSGLIIGMDLDGSFVQLSEDDGYSVDPVAQSLDQFEEEERIRLQEQVTQVIDPNGTMTQQPTEQQSGNVGGEAGTENSTGANEPPTPEPVNPPQPVNPQSPSGGESQPQQPAVTIESVTDKDGIKRYENGIPVDDAIADIQNDGFDVNEIADASIAEAQQAIDKINAKQTKTRKDLVDKKNAQDVITYYNNVKARWAEMNQPAESEEIVNVEPEAPNNPGNDVPLQEKKQENKSKAKTADEKRAERIKALKEQFGDDFDDDFTYAQTAEELASMYVGRNRTLSREDLAKELGYPLGVGTDEVWAETLLAKKGEGLSTWDVAHAAWQSDENPIVDNEGNKKFNDQEIHDALIRVFQNAKQKSDIMDYAVNAREEAARQKAEGRKRQEEEDAANQAPFVPFTEQELAQMKASLPFAESTDEEIPDSPIVQLEKAIAELQQQEGMPPISLIDTDRMREGDWIDLAAQYYGGEGFYSQEDIDNVRNYVLGEGVFFDPETGEVTVYSDSQTEEDVRKKVELLIEYKNDRVQEERRDNRDEADVSQRTETEASRTEEPETPAAEGANEPESQGSTGSVEDPYLQPRNAEEEQIVANVLAQLQQEIGDAVNERNKARSELQKAQARESERATDLFGNDNALNQEGQLFDNSDMPIDNSADGVDRRTAAEREKLQEATNKLNRLQSIEERNSRIRGALDNYRRQTVIETDGQPQTQSREEYLASHPLTEEQIMADTEANEDEKLNAIDFLNGEDSVISRFYYDQIYERAQNSSSEKRQKKEENKPAKEKKKEEKPQQPQDRWQYQFHYDKETGRAWITRDDWTAGVPIEDGRFRIEGNSLAELRGILENPKNNLGELLKEVDAALHNAEVGEEIRKATTPTEAIETAAQAFREEQKSKDQKDIDDALKEFNDFLDNAKGSNVLDKFMRKGLEGNDKAQASLLDAFTLTNEAQRMFLKDLLRLASKVGYAYIKSGVHDVQAWSKKMSDSIGAKLREVLGWDDAIIGEFVDEVWNQKYTVDGQRMRLSEHAERLKNGKGADTTVNVNKTENNEPENVVSSQQKPASELEGDSAEFADRQEKEKALRDDLKQELLHGVSGDRTLKTMQDVKKLAEKHGLDMSLTDLQEIVEAVIVDMARNYANNSFLTDKQKFDNIVALYQTQPTLSARDNDRINKQQYSTPAPMAFLMGQFLSNGKKVESGLEPSAGNGMLTINLPKEKMHVNDIDEMRLSNLQKQGFGEVTSQDGLQSFGEKKFDVVVTNPPFGNVTPKAYDGIYEISGLEHQMAINALESIKDDGRAAIIIGGNTEYNQNGSIKGKDRAFLNYLYAHYNVVDVINMNGHELYSRQGTGFPVRMILINGRKEFNPRSFAPTIQKARAERVNSYDELFKRVNDDILSDSNKPASVHDTESGKSDGKHDNGDAGNATQTGVRNVRTGGSSKQHPVLAPNGSSVQRGNNSADERTDTKGHKELGGGLFDVGSGSETPQHEGGETSQTELGGRGGRLASGGVDSERHTGGFDLSDGVGSRPSVEVRRLGTEKVPYRQQSTNPYSLQSQMPAEQADVVKKALEELGDVDEFLVKELGYSSVEDLHHGSQSPEKHGGLAAEQVDSVAMAIHQMNQGNAFIIGDQTGIGKGRQAAALIRYGVKKGGCPVFISVKKGLFSDMYRDLCDIGSPELRPFIWSADDDEHSADITDKNGNVVYKRPSDKEQKRVVEYINKNGKLPPEYDYIVTTYDSFKGGTMTYEEGKKQPRKFAKGKSATTGAINSQSKRDALERLAESSYVIMDESHNAGGETSAVSGYLQYITTKAKGVTFLSATFAKRPGNMPIYSLKTAISKAGVSVGELIDAVKRGGATFQEIMSKALTEAGQMIRRERDMTGVTIDWRGIEDEDIIQKQREQYDTVIGLFNDIIQFQRSYVDPIVNGMNDAAAEEQGEVDHTPGTRDMGINNTPFASRTYNMVQQVLLSLKAEEAAKRAIEHLKLGRKPVITVANTNEGAADEVAGADGESMEMPDLSVNLKKGLQGTMRITKKDAFGNTVNEMIPFDRLSEEGQKRYAEIMDAIENASSGLSLSPIDVIKNELKKAGYKVGELTGRKAEFVYNDDGTVKRVKRQDTDKKKIAADFNNGNIDALILNRSAGTGISLHASSTFKDQRQRIMIVAQAQGDVNDEVQIRGRIDRTGQVLRGMYEYVVSQIPSEQRLLMMLKAKLRSLDANTTSSQKSKFNEMQVQDIINKYGDDIVIQYLAEHPDLAMKMCDPLKWGEGAETLAPETLITQAQKVQGDGGTASKVLGRMALLTVKEQEKMLSEIGDLYQAEIDRLNEMGENDLEITEMPLRAKTVKKNVWEEGVEPGGKNPFADNSYIEEVEMDVLKKPMKGSEVKASQERLLRGKTWEEYKQATLEKADKWAEQKKAETTKTFTERAEKKAKAEQEKYVKGAKKAQEKNGMTDAEIEKNGKYQYDHFYKEEMDKLKTALEAIDNQKQVFVDALETFSTDGVYALPTDIYDLSGITFEPSFGKVIDISIKEDNYSTNASTITFATLDGRRKITIPINGMVKQNNGEKRDIKPIIVQQTAQTRNGMFGSNIANMLKVLEQNPDNWDKLTSTATRKKGHIITGNLLKALTSLRSQGKGGKLISYTTDTGEIRQGILMSDQFDPGTLMSKNPISSLKDNLRYDKDKVESDDGDVTVRVSPDFDWNNRGYNTLELIVPKSNKKGAKYFNDETLLSLMNGQFEGSSKMKAEFPRANLDAVMKRLDELGVTVQGEPKKDDNTNSGRRFDEDIDESIGDVNERFNERLDELEANPDQKDRILHLGTPGSFLRDAGIKDGEIVMEYDKFVRKSSEKYDKDHPFKAVDIKDLPKAINSPIAVFNSTSGNDKVILTELKKDGKNFVVVIRATEQPRKGGVKLVVNEIQTLYPKKTKGIVKWILDDLFTLIDKKKALNWITALQTHPGTAIDSKELISAANIIQTSQKSKDFSDFNTSNGKRYGESDASKQSDGGYKSRIAKHVDSLVKKLGTKARTTVYHSFDELPADMKKYIRERERQGKKVRGWYENGRVYLYLPHIDSEYAAEKTIWHETVAHHGLRQLIGEENLNKLLKQLWLTHREGEMGKWVAERMQKNGWALNEAIEEYLAREAEKNPFKEPGLWQRLKWMLADVLHKMGFSTDPTISDIRYLFWVSQNRLNGNDPLTKAKQQAFLFNLEREAANTPYVNMNAERVEDIYNPDAEGAYDDGIRHSEETDEEVIERLEKEPKIKVYRAMQLIDGKLYPPMAAKQGGKLVNPIELGKWEKADEHPEMADENGKFKLDKGNGKSLKAAYNPYIHTSTTMLNDQFSEAQNRPNLVVVEVEVPESELTSGYRAEKAKDAVGKLEWKAGVIQGQLTGTREVILSRWDKPVRIVPTEEVAKSIANQINGKVEVMPTNVVTPQQREELEKLGVKFVETDNRGFIKEGENAGKSYSSVYGKKANRRFDEDIDDPLTYSSKEVYNDRLNRIETVFTEAYQDAMVSLKTAQNAIAGYEDIPDSQNAYMAENLMHGKNKNEQDLFNAKYRDPLIRTINKILNLTGMNWGDVDRYVYTKSGLERNREFYVRDWLEAERNKTIRKYEDLNDEEQDIYEKLADRIETDFDDGLIATEEEKVKKLEQALQKAHDQYVDKVESEWIRAKNKAYQDLKDDNISFLDYVNELNNFIYNNIDVDYKPEEHDYSGFRAMFGDEDGVYDEFDAIAEVVDAEAWIESDNVDTLWNQINAATRYGLERYREAGMRSDEQIDKVEQMFHFYVPMRGFKEDRGEDMYQYFTGKDKSKNYIGGLLKHAKGRGSEANYPISTIFAMSYKAISNCNQNLVNQKLYRLCQANPNDLIILSDSWAVLNEQTGEWEEVGPTIPDDASEEEVREATLAFEEQMKDLATDGKAKKIKGREKFDYKPMDKKKQSEHIVDVRINGQPRKMIVTGNPRMAQALNGQLRFERGKNVFSKWNSAIKNMMASLFTSYSPTFALRNMFRDWTHFRTMLGVREGHGYAKQANKYYRQSLFKMVGLFKKYREGTLDESNEMERDFKEFMDNGGVTGFVQMQKIDDIQKQMEKLYKQQKEGKTIRLNNKVWDWTLGAIEALNEGIENNARFATYRASRHYAGRTKARSAYDAKEITVNFNKKGAGGKTAGFKSQRKAVEDAAKVFGVTSQILGEGKIFFNATVQAIATTFKNFQNADGSLNKPYIAKWAAKYALPPFLFGLALPMINKALASAFGGDDDDDPYANLAEWTRRKNICIWAGWIPGLDKNSFITIPIGQELAAFLALGDMFAGMTYAPELKPLDRSLDEEMVGIMNTFSPVDIDTKITKGGLMENPLDEVTGRTFSVLAPLVAVQQNLGWTGRPIYREDVYPSDKYNPEYQMVYSSTNPVLVGASKLANDLSGGDDVTRGKIQVNPAIVQYLWEQYTGGPGKVFSNTISIGKDAKDILSGNESDFNIRKVEGLKAFIQQGDDRIQYYRTLAKYRKYLEDARRMKDAENGYKQSAATDPLAPTKLEKMSASEEYVRMQIALEAEKSLSKINKAANQAEGKKRRELRQLYNEQVKQVVDMLDEVGKEQ